MYDDAQDRPPWLRNLRPRREGDAAPLSAMAALEPAMEHTSGEAAAETSPGTGRGLNRRQLLLLLVLLWANMTILGCLFLLATQRVVP